MHKIVLKCWPYLLLAFIGILLYSGIVKTYAFTDAYDFVYSAYKAGFINIFLQGGRPIYGLIMKLSYSHFNTVESLYVLRVISLMLAIFSCSFFFYYLIREGFGKFESFIISSLLLTSPSLAIKVVWSVLWLMPVVLFLAFLSGALLVRYQRKGLVTDLIMAFLLGLVVLLTYQPLYTFSLIPIFLNWLKNMEFKKLLRVGLIHLSVYAVYFLIFKSYLYLFDIPSQGRAEISLDIVERIKWFFTGPFTKLFIWNVFFVSTGLRWIVRVVIILSILSIFFHWLKQDTKKGLQSMSLVILFLLGMYIPNVLSSDNWVAYRTMDGLVFLPILFIWYGLFTSDLNSHFKSVASSLFLVLSITMAYINSNGGFTDLQQLEYQVVNSKISFMDNDIDTITFIPAPLKLVKEERILKRVVADEFGRLSTSSAWVPEPMTRLILKSLGRRKDIKLNILEPEEINVDGPSTIHVKTLFLRQFKIDNR